MVESIESGGRTGGKSLQLVCFRAVERVRRIEIEDKKESKDGLLVSQTHLLCLFQDGEGLQVMGLAQRGEEGKEI